MAQLKKEVSIGPRVLWDQDFKKRIRTINGIKKQEFVDLLVRRERKETIEEFRARITLWQEQKLD